MSELITNFSKDREENTNRLLSIPGLINRYSMVVGNQVFYPPGKYATEVMNHTKVNVDGHDMVIHSYKEDALADADKTDKGTKLIEAVNFTYRALEAFFNGKIPVEFKQSVYLLAIHRRDLTILEIGFNGDELMMLKQEAYRKLG